MQQVTALGFVERHRLLHQQMFASLELPAPDAVMQVAGQDDIDDFERIVREQFAIVANDANAGMGFTRVRLRLFGVRRNGDELGARRFDDGPRVMAAPRAKSNQREANGGGLLWAHEMKNSPLNVREVV